MKLFNGFGSHSYFFIITSGKHVSLIISVCALIIHRSDKFIEYILTFGLKIVHSFISSGAEMNEICYFTGKDEKLFNCKT